MDEWSMVAFIYFILWEVLNLVWVIRERWRACPMNCPNCSIKPRKKYNKFHTDAVLPAL